MPGLGFSFQDTDLNNTSNNKSWIFIIATVTLVTICIILLIRAFGSTGDKGNKGEQPNQAEQAEKTETNAEPVKQAQESTTRPSTPAAKVTQPAPQPAVTKVSQTNPQPAVTRPVKPQEPISVKEATPEVIAVVKAAESAERNGNYALARKKYLEALANKDCGSARASIEERLGAIDIELIFTPREMPGKIDYSVAGGDSLRKLANKYDTTIDLIVKSNNISNPNNLQIGDRLRILDHLKFVVNVSKTRNDLVVTMNGEFFKRYKVGTGMYAKTPEGTFKISDKIAEPPWWRPNGTVVPFGDKDNILGTRWMAITATGDTKPAKGYGIHGTWDDSSLGKQSSAGCIRMNNGDVEELFTYLPVGAEVVITE